MLIELRDVQSVIYLLCHCVIREYGCHLGPVVGSQAQQPVIPTAHSHSLFTSATTHGYICAVAAAIVGCAATGCMAVLILGLVISAGESKQGGLVRQLTEDDAKLITLYLGADPSQLSIVQPRRTCSLSTS